MQGPPRLSDEEIDLLLDVSLTVSEGHPEYYEGHLYSSNHCRPMFQVMSIDPGYDDNPEDYWSPDIAYWFADGRQDPWHPLEEEDDEEVMARLVEELVV